VYINFVDNFQFEPFKNELTKKMDTDINIPVNKSPTQMSNDFTLPIRPHFLTSEQFKLNFN